MIITNILQKKDVPLYEEEIKNILNDASEEINAYYNAITTQITNGIYDISDYLSDQYLIYSIKLDTTVVGIIILDIGGVYSTKVAHISLISVDRRYRRKGIALKALSYAISNIKQRFPVCNSVLLDVYSNNESAIALYRKLEFCELGKHMFLLIGE